MKLSFNQTFNRWLKTKSVQPLLDVDSVVAVDWLARFLLEFGQYWLD